MKTFGMTLGFIFGVWLGRLLVGVLLAFLYRLLLGDLGSEVIWFVCGFIAGDILSSSTGPFESMLRRAGIGEKDEDYDEEGEKR